jgi:hypothetical protein
MPDFLFSFPTTAPTTYHVPSPSLGMGISEFREPHPMLFRFRIKEMPTMEPEKTFQVATEGNHYNPSNSFEDWTSIGAITSPFSTFLVIKRFANTIQRICIDMK